MITINQYKEAKKEVGNIRKKETQTEDRLNKELTKVNDKYYKLERQIHDNKYKETQKIEKEKEKTETNFETMKDKHNPILEEYRQIMEFMDIIEDNKNSCLKEPKVYYYDYIYNEGGSIASNDKVKFYYKPVSVLVEDDLKKIYIYVTKNSKPKNCYSLVAVGNTLFNEKVIKMRFGYGIEAHEEDANINVTIKDLPTEEELKDYLKRNKKRILKDFLEQHTKAEETYKEVLKITEDSKEWKIAYLESRKLYYINNFSGGIETPEYKQIIEDLKGLGVGVDGNK